MLRELIVLKSLEMAGLLTGQCDPAVEALAGECQNVVQTVDVEERAPEIVRVADRAAEVIHRTAEAGGVKTPEAYVQYVLSNDQIIATSSAAVQAQALLASF